MDDYYIPQNFKTYEDALEFISQGNGIRLNEVPRIYLTEELCLNAIDQFGWVIKFIPENLRTEKILKASVLKDGTALQFILEEKKTYDICLTAVTNSGWSLKFVPEKFKNREIYEKATISYGSNLEVVPQEYLTKKLCTQAVYSIGYALKYVPKKYITKKLCLRALRKYEEIFHIIPNEYKTPEFCQMVVQINDKVKYYLPLDIRKGNFKTDINNKRSLKAYFQFTKMIDQETEYIEALMLKAPMKDIDEIGDYIYLYKFPKEMIPLLINTKNARLHKFMKDCLAGKFILYYARNIGEMQYYIDDYMHIDQYL